MSFISLSFFLFAALLLIVYYAVPKRFQWMVLLVFSCAFYAMAGMFGCFFILATSVSVYLGARRLQYMTDAETEWQKEHKGSLSKEERNKRKRTLLIKKRILLCSVLVLNFGVLCLFKYFDFGGLSIFGFSWVVPLGISFYTFQSVGYLVDVYWGNVNAQKNYFKTLLFISFFPQITQGPISVYEELSAELFAEHAYSYLNFSRGFRRFMWGMLKKLMIADFLAPYVKEVFSNYGLYSGHVALLGAFVYSVQIYADFSGYMDMACGISRMLGIKLTENFERPYFSKSIAEYWRRWHISLGTWFKRYIYYPVAMARWNKKFGKTMSAKVSRGAGKNVPAAIALIATWAATGVWHGNNAGYLVWGLLNGAFIIISLWTDPVFAGWKKKLNINESAFLWRAFTTIRTFILVTFIKVLPEVGSLRDGLGLWRHTLRWTSLPQRPGELLPSLTPDQIFNVKLAFVFTVCLFISSLIQRKRPLEEVFERVPFILRVLIMAGLTAFIIGFGISLKEPVGGFMYARF